MINWIKPLILKVLGVGEETLKLFNNPELKKINAILKELDRKRLACNIAEKDFTLFDDLLFFAYTNIKDPELRSKINWYKAVHRKYKDAFNKKD